jgi:hypothetical protein
MLRGLGRERVEDGRRLLDNGLAVGHLAVQHAEGVPPEPGLAFPAERRGVGPEVVDEPRDVRRAVAGVADGVDVQRHA